MSTRTKKSRRSAKNEEASPTTDDLEETLETKPITMGSISRRKRADENNVNEEAGQAAPVAAPLSPRLSRGRSRSKLVAKPEELVVEEDVAPSDFEALRDLLDSKGYAILRGVAVGGDDNSNLAFVVATVAGNIVYIDLDTLYTNLKPRAKDLSIRRVIKTREEPVEDEITASKCSSLGVCGSVYECSDGFCTIQRDLATMGLEKAHFTISSKREMRRVHDEDELLPAYPMVKLSEIMVNNIQVLKNIEREVDRLDAEAAKLAIERRMIFKESVNKLARAAENLNRLLQGAQSNVLNALAIAHKEKLKLKFPPLPEQKELYNMITHKVLERRRLFEDLVHRTKLLEDLTAEAEEFYDALKEMFEVVQKEYDV